MSLPSASAAGPAGQQSSAKAHVSLAAAAAAAHRSAQDDSHYYGDEDGDDVFSNPDTAELESRSDATGATSPTPNSPGPGSPSNRLSSHIAIVSGVNGGTTGNSSSHHQQPYHHVSTLSDPFVSLRQNELTQKPPALSSLPVPPSAAELQRQYEQRERDETPRASAGNLSPSARSAEEAPYASSLAAVAGGVMRTPSKGTQRSGRPAFIRAKSASGITVQGLQSPNMQSTTTTVGRAHSPNPSRLGGHASSLSASHVSLAHGQLPSAHGLPNNPRDAMSISKLFAHTPCQSPGDERPGFMFGQEQAAGTHGLRGSNSALLGTSPVRQDSAPAAHTRRLSRPSTRPTSPERLTSPFRKGHRASLGTGLGPSARNPADSGDEALASESSIFERDIEHRNASHVLSKQEAIDVAIPSVLDDAVEALAANDSEIEVVAPHAAPPPLALSAQALTAHSHSQSRLSKSATGSPVLSNSPPLSNVGAAGATEPPPGSMAALIAERFQQRAAQPASGEAPAAPGISTLSPAVSRHHRPQSDASVSSSSSLRSRSPKAPAAMGMQRVLSSAERVSPGLRSASHSPPAPGKPSSLSAAPTASSRASSVSQSQAQSQAKAGSPRHVITGQASSSTLTPSKFAGLPTASALPSLPLPNPFRSTLPSPGSTSFSSGDAAGFPMQSSLSVDGAVMPSNETATLDASLDGLADAVTSKAPTAANSVANSPSMRLRGLALVDEAGLSPFETSPYSSRSPVTTSLTAPHSPTSPTMDRQRRSAPFGEDSKVLPSSASLADTATESSSTFHNKKRLSFFSYADILNETPGEVMRIDEALRQADASMVSTASAGDGPVLQ